MENEAIVETRDLVKVYGDGARVRALDEVNMRIAQGEFVSVMGPSGSGKSTLLNMIGALDRPTGGQVLVNGEDLATVRDLDDFRAHTVGFIFQLHNLIPTLTAHENVEVPMMGQPVGRGIDGGELRSCWIWSGWRTGCIICPISCPVVSGSASPSLERWPINPRWSWPTNPPVI